MANDDYLIPFWTVFSVVLTIVGLLIWLGLVKSRDNQRIETGAFGVRYLVEQYVDHALQKTVYHMLRYDKMEAKKGMDVRLRVAREACAKTDSPALSRNLFFFPRGREVAEALYRELSDTPRFENTNLFLLPDVLVHVSGNVFYFNLLNHAARVVVNDSAAFDNYSNDDAKQYLGALLKQASTTTTSAGTSASSTPETSTGTSASTVSGGTGTSIDSKVSYDAS